jgi:hypothetical protein
MSLAFTRFGKLLVSLALLVACNAECPAAAADDAAIKALATEAYIFGYPLVTMEMTRRVMTNVSRPGDMRAPMGHFYHAQAYPKADFRDVTAPNADTLYSVAWIDLADGPYVLSLPDEADRYFLLPMLDAWTNVFQVPGKRTTGTKAQTYVITGPGWKGDLPDHVTETKSPTNLVWILGRTYCTGTPADYAAVHALQAQYKLAPLRALSKPHALHAGEVDPNIDMKTPVRDQVNRLPAREYFQLLAQLMKDNPPAAEDAPMMAKLEKIGIVPGRPFDPKSLGTSADQILAEIPAAAQRQMAAQFGKGGQRINNWMFMAPTGVYGTDYLQRAMVAAFGLGANRQQDAVYPVAETDADGQPLSGAKSYVIHFNKGETPPVEGFWSLTMYDAQFFFVQNPLNRQTLSPRDALKYNTDGSLDLYVQHQSPGVDKEANWLPAPAGKFILMLRMYWPREASPSILNGSWKVPPIKRS